MRSHASSSVCHRKSAAYVKCKHIIYNLDDFVSFLAVKNYAWLNNVIHAQFHHFVRNVELGWLFCSGT